VGRSLNATVPIRVLSRGGIAGSVLGGPVSGKWAVAKTGNVPGPVVIREGVAADLSVDV
jgi:hypothetical protein